MQVAPQTSPTIANAGYIQCIRWTPPNPQDDQPRVRSILQVGVAQVWNPLTGPGVHGDLLLQPIA
jgi:hypothetical protein